MAKKLAEEAKEKEIRENIKALTDKKLTYRRKAAVKRCNSYKGKTVPLVMGVYEDKLKRAVAGDKRP